MIRADLASIARHKELPTPGRVVRIWQVERRRRSGHNVVESSLKGITLSLVSVRSLKMTWPALAQAVRNAAGATSLDDDTSFTFDPHRDETCPTI